MCRLHRVEHALATNIAQPRTHRHLKVGKDGAVTDLIRPMLAVLSDELPPEDGSWAYEMKWDGVRTVIYLGRDRLKAMSRNDIDMIGSYPELRDLALPKKWGEVVLDGEIVAMDRSGRPSFERLQSRMHVGDAARARHLAESTPVTFLAFDILRRKGKSVLKLPYVERRRQLEELALDGPAWKTPPYWSENGADVLQAARHQQLEGVLAKQIQSLYYPGRRFKGWLKVKNLRTQEVLIAGWTPGEGSRQGTIGALLLGIPGEGGLRYAGKVGTGFTQRALRELADTLEALAQPGSPLVDDAPRKDVVGANWVRPRIVGEVRFSEWTQDGRLRHPAWRGLRPDKSPSDVVLES
jgi:bifunctional non-homologous end joining protein LigD